MNRSDRKPLEEILAGFEIATPEIIDFQSTMFKTEELKPLFSHSSPCQRWLELRNGAFNSGSGCS